MKVKNIPIDQITVGDRYRVPAKLDELISSIREKGLIQPITVSTELMLLTGARRLAAVKQLGELTIPCVIRKVVDELDARELELFENIHRMDMAWNERLLLIRRIHVLMGEKHKGDWTQSKTAKLIERTPGRMTQMLEMCEVLDTVPELANCSDEQDARKTFKRMYETSIVEQAEERFQQENKASNFPVGYIVKTTHWTDSRYLIGDALEGLPTISEQCMDFAEVDPPYGIDIHKVKQSADSHPEYNEIPREKYPEFIQTVAVEVYRILTTDAYCIWWHGNEWFTIILNILAEVGFKVDVVPAIWYKEGGSFQTGSPDVNLGRAYEQFFICRKGTPLLRNRGRSNVFAFKPLPHGQKIHMTEKPLLLMEEILKTFVYPGAKILSPFIGSGVTIIAARKVGCTAFGWELTDSIKPSFKRKAIEAFNE